jgi:hypothetical protein
MLQSLGLLAQGCLSDLWLTAHVARVLDLRKRGCTELSGLEEFTLYFATLS